MSEDGSIDNNNNNNNNNDDDIEFDFAPMTTAWQTTTSTNNNNNTNTSSKNTATGRSRRQAYGRSKRSAATNLSMRSFISSSSNSVPSSSLLLSSSGLEDDVFQSHSSSWHTSLDDSNTKHDHNEQLFASIEFNNEQQQQNTNSASNENSNAYNNNRPPRSKSLQLQRGRTTTTTTTTTTSSLTFGNRRKARRSISMQSSNARNNNNKNNNNHSPPMIRKQSFTLLQDQENFHPNYKAKASNNDDYLDDDDDDDDEALKPIKLMKVGSHNASSRSSFSNTGSSEHQHLDEDEDLVDDDEEEEDDFRGRSCSPAFSSAAQSVCSTGSFSELAAVKKDSSTTWGQKLESSSLSMMDQYNQQQQQQQRQRAYSASTAHVVDGSNRSAAAAAIINDLKVRSPPIITKGRMGRPRTRFCYGSLNDIQTSSSTNDDDFSPSQSLTPSLGSSRKRCNYGSPILEPNGNISTGGRSSGKGSSLGRCRSRSRIFSPEFISSQHDPSNDDEDDDQSVKTAVDAFQEIRSKEDDTDEEKSMDQSKEISEDEFPPPPAPRRIPTPTFGQSKSENTDLRKTHKENLKYMYIALRKVVKSKKPRIFGASNNVPILPPSDWPSERKAIFLSWAITDLHFDVLNLGGNMGEYLQTSMERSIEIFEDIRTELRELKAQRRLNVVKPVKEEDGADNDCNGEMNSEKPSAMKALSFRSPEPVGMDISAKKIM